MGEPGKVRAVRGQCGSDAGRKRKKQEWELQVQAQSFSWDIEVGERNTQF